MSTLSAQILVLITHPKLSGFFGESGDSRYVLGIIQWPWNVLLYLTIRVVQNVVVAWKKKESHKMVPSHQNSDNIRISKDKEINKI